MATSGGLNPGVPALAAWRWGRAWQESQTWGGGSGALAGAATLRVPWQEQEAAELVATVTLADWGMVEERCEVRLARRSGVPRWSVVWLAWLSSRENEGERWREGEL